MKFLVILIACFLYAFFNTFIAPLILEPLTTDVEPLTVGTRAGFINLICIVVLTLLVKFCFNKIDTIKYQKERSLETAHKEHIFQQERIYNDILRQIKEENLSALEIDRLILDTNLDSDFQQKLKSALNQLNESESQLHSQTTFSNNPSWKCISCGTENSTNYMQCKKCGKYKSSQNTKTEDIDSTLKIKL